MLSNVAWILPVECCVLYWWASHGRSWETGPVKRPLNPKALGIFYLPLHVFFNLTVDAMNCSLSESLLKAARGSNSAARGWNKIAFKIVYNRRPYILKTIDLEDVYAKIGSSQKGGFNTKASKGKISKAFIPPIHRSRKEKELRLKKEAELLLQHSSPWGLPHIFGYCFTDTFSWVLLEDAYGSLVDLPFPMNPSCHQLDRLMFSIVQFLDESDMFPLNKLQPYQFGITRDWRLIIVDTDILVDSFSPTQKKCKRTKDCTTPKHHKLKKCRKTSCVAGFCRFAEESHCRSCFLIFQIFPWLSKFYFLDLPRKVENLQEVPSLTQLAEILKMHSRNNCSADIGQP